MNSIDFLKYNQFPLSTETFSAIQDMIFMVTRLASLGGNLYILSGCQKIGNSVTPGYVVINGEILPFDGGPESQQVTIMENKSSVAVNGETYQDIYTARKVVFGTGAISFPWSSFKSLKDLSTLTADINSISSNLANHLGNHTVTWNNVTGKPSLFVPVVHRHSWSEVDFKPATYPPSQHNHPGMAVFLGHFDRLGTTVTKLFGTFDVGVANVGSGKYKLIHNLGHTNYIILGVGGADNNLENKTDSLRSMLDITPNSCIVVVSNDYTPENSEIRFCILSFQ